MHSAPAVRYPVARSSRVGVALLAVWGLVSLVCLWWWLRGGAPAWQLGAAVVLLVLGASMAFVQWRAMPTGALRWDGQAWWWQTAGEDEVLVSLQVRLDLQHGILVDLAGLPLRAGWCYAERAALPARWSDLRRALYSPRSALPPGVGAVSPP